MADTDVSKITAAASAVVKALADLTLEEQQRVLQSAAALYGHSGGQAYINNSTAAGPELPGTQGHVDGPVGNSRKQQSIVEFLREKNPATNGQRLACFAYYREHVEKKGPNFSRADLKPYFQTAKLTPPGKNFDRDYTRAVKQGWIHDDGAKSYLTNAGETVVASGFGGKALPRGATSSPKRSRRSASAKKPASARK